MPAMIAFIKTSVSLTLGLGILICVLIPFAPAFGYDEPEAIALYNTIDYQKNQRPQFDIFQRALAGYIALQQSGNVSTKKILTIIDFRKPSNEKRLWVIDLEKQKLLFHSLTAHGRNTGNLFAENFSNTPNSNQSSLGFYITGQKYIGKHGVSLKLHGVEKGINDLAESRAIVMHGADYVSESYIKKYGRLGRSFGCPAVPMGLHEELIPILANGTCLFIFYPDARYLAETSLTVLGIGRRQDLDGDVTAQPRVASAEDFAHAAGTDRHGVEAHVGQP
jgi:hypothetical protein